MNRGLVAALAALTLGGCGGGGGSAAPAASQPPPGPCSIPGDGVYPFCPGEKTCPDWVTIEVPRYADIRDPDSRYVEAWTYYTDDDCNVIRHSWR